MSQWDAKAAQTVSLPSELVVNISAERFNCRCPLKAMVPAELPAPVPANDGLMTMGLPARSLPSMRLSACIRWVNTLVEVLMVLTTT